MHQHSLKNEISLVELENDLAEINEINRYNRIQFILSNHKFKLFHDKIYDVNYICKHYKCPDTIFHRCYGSVHEDISIIFKSVYQFNISISHICRQNGNTIYVNNIPCDVTDNNIYVGDAENRGFFFAYLTKWNLKKNKFNINKLLKLCNYVMAFHMKYFKRYRLKWHNNH